jgi:hypothetical protein
VFKKSFASLNITPKRPVKVKRYFGGIYRLQILAKKETNVKKAANRAVAISASC